MKITPTNRAADYWIWTGLFLTGRLILLLATPLEGLRGYGDLSNYLQLARLGRPYLDYWVEFPPIFPFLNFELYRLAAGQEHVYLYLFFILMTLCQAGSLFLFTRLATTLASPSKQNEIILVFFVLTLVLPYGWWYFDPLAVLFLLLGITLYFEGRDDWVGVFIAIGVLSKFFPVLLLPAIWKSRPVKQAARITIIAVCLVGLVYGALYLNSPTLTVASLASQLSKGSWETVWALIDANFHSGNFGPYLERYDSSKAYLPLGNPAAIPTWLTLIGIGFFGGWVWLKASLKTPSAFTAFVGFTWCLFLLWSPGWSPQWALYLAPLFLLALADKEGILLTTIFVLVNLLEWPVLLARGYNWGLWISVPLRTLTLLLAAYLFWRRLNAGEPIPERVN